MTSIHQKKILLVEDDQLLLTLLKFRLEERGLEVMAIDNGLVAKQILGRQEFQPDLIISDILMPLGSGIELIDYVRNKLNMTLPIILISSAGQEELILDAFEYGITDFVHKPFNVSELLVRISNTLENTTRHADQKKRKKKYKKKVAQA